MCIRDSGNLVQKEYAGTESKSETEKLLRQAMDDYESKKFIAKSENITIGELLDIWAEEELKTGTLSNGTVPVSYTHLSGIFHLLPAQSNNVNPQFLF